MQITIGIDISKETVVAYRLPDNQSIQVANDRAGQKTLVRWIGKQNGSLVVFEATGAYHRLLEAALAANGTPFAKVNPRQARRFAEATECAPVAKERLPRLCPSCSALMPAGQAKCPSCGFVMPKAKPSGYNQYKTKEEVSEYSTYPGKPKTLSELGITRP
jgi:transposase